MENPTQNPTQSNTVIYAVGGTGINLVNRFEKSIMKDKPTATAYYVDTSNSNVKSRSVPPDRLYVFSGKDGGGKIRGNTHEPISSRIDQVLSKMKPGMFNVIVSSSGGGTGGVAAQAIAHQLLLQNKLVVLVVVGSTASLAELKNTRKTILSFENLAQNIVKKPVVVHYLENSTTSTRATIDNHAVGALALLTALFSGVHDELDSEDLRSWLNHSSLGRRLVDLQFSNGAEDFGMLTNALSVATLAKPGAVTDLNPMPAYQAVGFVPPAWLDAKPPLMEAETLNFIIGDGIFLAASQRLKAAEDAADDEVNGRARRDDILAASDGDSGQPNGIFL
jgi:hypothetical protein